MTGLRVSKVPGLVQSLEHIADPLTVSTPTCGVTTESKHDGAGRGPTGTVASLVAPDGRIHE